jgi:hypothetical protein
VQDHALQSGHYGPVYTANLSGGSDVQQEVEVRTADVEEAGAFEYAIC